MTSLSDKSSDESLSDEIHSDELSLSEEFEECIPIDPCISKDVQGIGNVFRTLDYCDVELLIDPKRLNLDSRTCQAWDIDVKIPLKVVLHGISAYNYKLHPPKNIYVFQRGTSRDTNATSATSTTSRGTSQGTSVKSAIGVQLSFILSTFCKTLWTFSTDDNFFVSIIDHTIKRAKTLCDYCIVCDQPHLATRKSLIKPVVCRRELCAFMCNEFLSNVQLISDVTDLLIAMAKAAVNSSRRELIFTPFPTVFDGDKVVLTEDKPDYNLAATIINQIDVFSSFNRTRIEDSMFNAIVNSNGTYLVKLDKHLHISSLKTDGQYVMLSASPEKEVKFQELKTRYGSKFAFHGSRLENWHSILRLGLKNASGTKLQLNGAAHGKGIYLSTMAGYSCSYSAMRANTLYQPRTPAPLAPASALAPSMGDLDLLTTEECMANGDWSCLALCEVAMEKKCNGTIWVIPNEDCVVTRFLFVYKKGIVDSSVCNINSITEEFEASVLNAMQTN